jgi:hypothetical protein
LLIRIEPLSLNNVEHKNKGISALHKLNYAYSKSFYRKYLYYA